MKLLTVTTLYPNAENPRHGIFIQTRLQHLLEDFRDVDVKVIAPVPWFPFRAQWFGQYARYARVARHEKLQGLEVHHPRYLVIPKVGMYLTPFFLFLSIYLSARKLRRSGYAFELIDGHYCFPDGVAIAAVAKRLRVPFTVTARGSDITLIPAHLPARRMLRKLFQRADRMITVCDALRRAIIELGADPGRVETLRNGVDLRLFCPPADRKALRGQLGIESFTVLSVGNLVPLKGHDLVIRAVSELPGIHLLIIGEGPEKDSLMAAIERHGIEDRVQLLGVLQQTQLKDYYGAADLLGLASEREGWANVLLESMACGTPVVATNIWGTPEVVRTADAGRLVERDVESIKRGIEQSAEQNLCRKAVRRYAEQFAWRDTSAGQYRIFSDLVRRRR